MRTHMLTCILVVQKRAVRIIARLSWRESCRNAFRELKLLTVPSAYILDCIAFVLENGDSTLVEDVTEKVTRRGRDLHISPRRLCLSDSHALQQGRILFNALPAELKAKRRDFMLLNRLLRDYLVKGVFYSLSEFKRVSGRMG